MVADAHPGFETCGNRSSVALLRDAANQIVIANMIANVRWGHGHKEENESLYLEMTWAET